MNEIEDFDSTIEGFRSEKKIPVSNIPKKKKLKTELIDEYFDKCKLLRIEPPLTENKLKKTKKDEIETVIKMMNKKYHDLPADADRGLDDDAEYENDMPMLEPNGQPFNNEEDVSERPVTRSEKQRTGRFLFKANVLVMEALEGITRAYDPLHDMIDLRGLADDMESKPNEKMFTDIYEDVALDFPNFARYITHWSGRAILGNANLVRACNSANKKKTRELNMKV